MSQNFCFKTSCEDIKLFSFLKNTFFLAGKSFFNKLNIDLIFKALNIKNRAIKVKVLNMKSRT